ncbi:MAG: M20/M25/M40 family metallo-hydrolase [Promethearchaeia archaeon]
MSNNRYSEDFIRALSFPRMAGTEGEKKAQELIESEFKRMGVEEYRTQEFKYSWFYMNTLLRIYDVITALLIISTFFLIILDRYYLSLILGIILFVYSFYSRQIREYLHFKVLHLGKDYKSKNYIAKISAQHSEVSRANVVFFAHYDSISHKLHPIFSGALYFLGLVGGSLFSLHLFITIMLYHFSVISSIPYLFFSYGFVIALVISLQIFNTRDNKSPGTGDNATGVSNVFYLLEHFHQNPLSHTNLTFVFTGAEEAGDLGAYNFIKEFHSQFDVKHTYFIIVDTVALNEKENLYFYGQGYPKQIFSPHLKKKTEMILTQNEKYQKTLNEVYIPPLIAYSTDHTPLKFYGYEFIIFGSNGRIHSEEDNPDHLHPNMMKNFNEFSQDLVITLNSSFLSPSQREKEN